jgi:hypothetical protein
VFTENECWAKGAMASTLEKSILEALRMNTSDEVRTLLQTAYRSAATLTATLNRLEGIIKSDNTLSRDCH